MSAWKTAFATSPAPSVFGPLLFAGDVEAAVAAAGGLGFDGIEVSLRSPEELDAGRLAEALAGAGLELSAVGTGRAFLEDGLSLSADDRAIRTAALERLLALTVFAARFSAVVIVGLIRGARPASADGSRELGLVAEGVRVCADAAASAGVQVVVEAINRYETRFLNTAEETLRLLDAVDRPNVRVLLDVFHMNIEETVMSDAVRAAGPRLGYFHVVDSNRRAPGLGHVDYGPLLSALRDIDYRGWVSAEVLPLPDDGAAAGQAIDFLRRHESEAGGERC